MQTKALFQRRIFVRYQAKTENGVINLQLFPANYPSKLNSGDDWKNIVMKSLRHQSYLSDFAYCLFIHYFKPRTSIRLELSLRVNRKKRHQNSKWLDFISRLLQNKLVTRLVDFGGHWLFDGPSHQGQKHCDTYQMNQNLVIKLKLV